MLLYPCLNCLLMFDSGAPLAMSAPNNQHRRQSSLIICWLHLVRQSGGRRDRKTDFCCCCYDITFTIPLHLPSSLSTHFRLAIEKSRHLIETPNRMSNIISLFLVDTFYGHRTLTYYYISHKCLFTRHQISLLSVFSIN